MKKYVSLWVLLVEIVAIAALHANKDNADRIKDILLKRNQSGLIKTTPITPAPIQHPGVTE
ncbi:hypothetical protein [Flavihumibacter petaseus]|uniref:Uncharacterized protein n=1 Tax=Flavihumibacter petaseus NBRC 106054 TaxID=1220578 RepID=A0A0E9N311_9BACT|nr:hypothetical protein [Flavihumibacter petaseus]GAO44178.1 hypothetical protein FPE01S_03_02160 [Flavihumibacter petaseus NBRC 106054]